MARLAAPAAAGAAVATRVLRARPPPPPSPTASAALRLLRPAVGVPALAAAGVATSSVPLSVQYTPTTCAATSSALARLSWASLSLHRAAAMG